jgi:hypothetical protein
MVGRSHSGAPLGRETLRVRSFVAGNPRDRRVDEENVDWRAGGRLGSEPRGPSSESGANSFRNFHIFQPGLERERKRNVMIEAHWRGELRRPATCAT